MTDATRLDKSPELCQIETAQGAGNMRRPGFLYVPMRILQNLRARGWRYTIRITIGSLIAGARKNSKVAAAKTNCKPTLEGMVLNLQPGELVQVKSLEDILKSLDGAGKLNGLVFTPEMRKHCNKQYRVYKRLELMFDEYHRSQRRVKNTVLLAGVVCEGAGLGCDRCCFLYWREAWLQRVEESQNSAISSSVA